jgi:hypothetical protein
MGGVRLPLALAELGLIDEYELVVQPRLAGHGPTLFAGLSKHIDFESNWRDQKSHVASRRHGRPGLPFSPSIFRPGRPLQRGSA